MINTRVLKKVSASVVIGLLIVLGIVWFSEGVFGDLTDVDSLNPLLIIIPVMAGVAAYLYYKD